MNYTPQEEGASLAALEQFKQQNLPWYYQGAVSDAILKQIVDIVLTAAAKVRNG